MKIIIALSLMLLTACTGVPTYNARTYSKQSAVIFETDQGLVVQEDDGTHTPYMFYTDVRPTQEEIAAFYAYNFKTDVIDENEAKALNTLGIAMAGDIITSQIGFNKGCVEKNILAKAAGPYGMAAYSTINWGIFAAAAKGSTIYEATKKKDSRKIYAGAAFKGYYILKNIRTIAKGC